MDNLTTVDWAAAAWGLVWVSGLALALAALSFAYYEAGQQRAGEDRADLRAVLARRGYQTALAAGLALFCLGIAGGGGAWWERALWAALGVGFGWLAVRSWKREAGGRQMEAGGKNGEEG